MSGTLQSTLIFALEKKRKGSEDIFEDIIAENFLTWETKQTSRSRKHTVSNRINPRRTTPRYIVIKMAKTENIKTSCM